MEYRFFISAFCLLLFFSNAISQSVIITDHSSGLPITHVGVFSSDSLRFTYSDNNGRAEMKGFLERDLIVFQHPSYQSLIMAYGEVIKLTGPVRMTEKIIRMGELVISANKWEQNSEEIPQSIITIPPDQFEFNNVQTAADLLSGSGKIFVQKSQLGGGSPMIRGFAANAILIVVDGVRMNNAIFRQGNLQNIINIDPNMVQHAEVIEGPGSVIYGSDAMGGIMDFHTIEPRFAPTSYFEGKALARFSSANLEKTGHLQWSAGGKNLSYFGGISFSDFDDLMTGNHRTDQFPDFGKRPEYVARINDVDSLIPNKNENLQVPSGFRQFSTMQKIRVKINKKADLSYAFHFNKTSDIPRYDRLIDYDTETGYPVNAEWYYGPQKWMMNHLKINLKKYSGIYDRARIILAYQQFLESRHSRRFRNIRLTNREERVDLATVNIDFEKVIKYKHNLFYGLEYTGNWVGSEANSVDIETNATSAATTRYPDGGSTMFTLAAYGSYKYDITSAWHFSAGLRYNFTDLSCDFKGSDLPFSNIKSSNGAFNGNLGLVWIPSNTWNIGILYSSGFRAPNVDDIAKVFDSEPGNVMAPNPDLKPEYSYNMEGRVTKTIGEKIRIQGAFFMSFLREAIARRDFTFNGKDSIIYDGTPSRVQALVNVGRANIYGGNIGLTAGISPKWSVSSYLNYTTGHDLDEDIPLRHTTPVFGNTSVTYHANKLKLELDIRYNGKRDWDDLPPSEQNKPYLYTSDGSLSWYTINLRGSYQINSFLGINAALENILNHHYRPYSSGISAPGINAIISVYATF